MEIIKELELQFEYKFWTYYGTMEKMFTQNILNKENVSIEYVFNELGKDGWELFTILQGKENCLFIFKRSKWVEEKAQEKQEEQADVSWDEEDEKTRKAILDYIIDEVNFNTKLPISRTEAFKWISWLKKQGNKPQGKKALEAIHEQKPNNKPKFKVGDFVKDTNHHKQPIYKIVSINKECYICESDDVTLGDKAVMHFAFDNPYLRLVEQKPAWSKEDENNLTDTCVAIRKFYHGTNGAQELIDWLKYLKQRMKGE